MAATRYVFPGYVWHAAICLALMAALPMAYVRLRGRPFRNYLLAAGNLRLGLKYSAILLAAAMPVMLYGSALPEFKGYYPLWRPASDNLVYFAYYEAYMLAVMVATEVFYRGFLLNTLLQDTRWGNWIHALVYMLAHVGKPPVEVVYSLPVGWVFGRVDTKCGSILPSLAMHYLSSLIFDLLVMYHGGFRLI